ncbi:MAG: CoA transferase [Clostridiales Family XIII bacterium]|nr:CoA transferase [Clostridiales Family XIII bacterium]
MDQNGNVQRQHSPQFKARDYFLEIDHPRVGRRVYPGLPYKLQNAHPRNHTGAPLLGQHNEEFFCGHLGMSKEELKELVEAKIIYRRKRPGTYGRSEKRDCGQDCGNQH